MRRIYIIGSIGLLALVGSYVCINYIKRESDPVFAVSKNDINHIVSYAIKHYLETHSLPVGGMILYVRYDKRADIDVNAAQLGLGANVIVRPHHDGDVLGWQYRDAISGLPFEVVSLRIVPVTVSTLEVYLSWANSGTSSDSRYYLFRKRFGKWTLNEERVLAR